MLGIVHRPSCEPKRGILIAVAGGPQYRVGGHRQLVLWSRCLASAGYAVFRFDYRGWGDSHGDFHDFDDVGDDLRAAMDCFKAEVPEVEEFVMWGECNASSAILFYAHTDMRVKGLVLLNPWVRTTEGQAKAIVRHYYMSRLKEVEFWKKMLSGRFNPYASLRSALSLVFQARKKVSLRIDAGHSSDNVQNLPLPDRMLSGLSRFKGRFC